MDVQMCDVRVLFSSSGHYDVIIPSYLGDTEDLFSSRDENIKQFLKWDQPHLSQVNQLNHGAQKL